MRQISKRVHREIDASRFHKKCARAGQGCSGRLTMEHAFIYGGRQIDEAWAIIPLCWHHHLGPGLEKGINQLIALRRATDDDLKKYPRTDWKQLRAYLEKRYGGTSAENR